LFKTEENEEIKYYVSEYSKTIDMLKPDSDYSAIALLYKTGALNEYGSFAGEFHVDGEVKLNVITKKYHVTGSQTVEQWEDIKQEGSLA
jgi:phage baseplate assembly protein gpV